MNNMVRLLVLATVFAVLQGCVAWTRVDQTRTEGPGGQFVVELPQGWMRAAAHEDAILITRDGFLLQAIEVRRLDHDKAFADIEKSSSADMLPSELAELTVAEARASSGAEHLQVLSNEPVEIGGRPGFRLQLQIRNPRGLRYERVIYGMADADGFYQLTYQAPRLHYFERDLQAFEAMVRSFQHKGGATRQTQRGSAGSAG